MSIRLSDHSILLQITMLAFLNQEPYADFSRPLCPEKNGVPRDQADRIVQLLRERGSLSVQQICEGVGVYQITARPS